MHNFIFLMLWLVVLSLVCTSLKFPKWAYWSGFIALLYMAIAGASAGS